MFPNLLCENMNYGDIFPPHFIEISVGTQINSINKKNGRPLQTKLDNEVLELIC